jgi:PKD repeat protein
MKEGNEKKLFAVIAVAIIVLVVFVGAIFKQEIIDEARESKLFAGITASKNSGTAPLNINFKALILNNKGKVDYHWEFGNGITSKEKDPSIIYEKEGEYNCSLKVTDESGETKIDSMKIVVNKNKPPVVTLFINQNTISREFNWLEILTLTPIAGYAGNQQLFLDMVEEKKGANAWGEGRLIVTAQIMDPEDDEIVSYDWKVQTSDTVVTSMIAGMKEWIPVKNLTGEKNVTIPELYAWTDKGHIAILTVTDSAGNNATASIQFSVSQSSKLTKITGLKNGIKTTLPLLAYFWALRFIEEPVSTFLDKIWFTLPSNIQNAILWVLNFIKWDYDPPIPKADLDFSDIDDLNLSTYVNDTGVVQPGASIRSDFVILNNDSLNTTESVYITLYNEFSDEKGLPEEIKVEGLSVDLNAGAISNKIFYNGKYTNWTNCYNANKLPPGDFINLGITVTLKEGAIFNKGSYPCKLYVYQGRSSDKLDYVDEIPFTIII